MNVVKSLLGALMLALVFLACSDRSINKLELPKVNTIELSNIDPDQFSPEEWWVPYYLKNFSTVANSLIDTGQNRGYINIAVWRTPDVNKPYNARIMESILSLTWFYTTDRPWNPYYNDPALRKRIEASLTFWCNMQNSDGRFSEYAPARWSLAPTAFATKFVGRALYLLEKGPTIDREILKRAVGSLQKALFIGFTDSTLWEHGRNYTNQYANLWGGAMMYLQHHHDQVIDQLLTNRLNDSMVEFQSPCGYFYEKNGPDWGYNLSTHHSDLQVAWHFAQRTRLQDYFIEKTDRWYDWFSYNAVKEPGSSRYYLNKGIETRQQKWYIDTDTLEDPRSARWTPQAEFVPAAYPFVLSKEEYDQQVNNHYAAMREQYPAVFNLKEGEFWSFSPYAFLHNELNKWLPTRQQKENAIAELPYLKRDHFTEVRSDRRNGTMYSFVRRPGYYVIFNSGKIITDQQRYGIGLIWNPVTGTVFQSQSKSNTGAWGTRGSGNEQVYEASDVEASFLVEGKPWKPAPGVNSIEKSFSLTYPLGIDGNKKVEFLNDEINIEIKHSGAFTEVIPLLVNTNDHLVVNEKSIVLGNGVGRMTLRFDAPVKLTMLENSIDTHGGKPCKVIEIDGQDRLNYSISFNK